MSDSMKEWPSERIAQLETELMRLQAENARLKAPVSREEMRVFGWILSDVVKARFDLLIVARATAPAGTEMGDRDQQQAQEAPHE